MNDDLLIQELSLLLPDGTITIGNALSLTKSIEKAVYINDRPYIIDRIVPCNYTEQKAAGLLMDQYLTDTGGAKQRKGDA